VAFSGEINDCFDFVFGEDFVDEFGVADVAFDEDVVFVFEASVEIFEVAGVGEFVEVDDEAFGVFVEKHSDKIAADESGSSCNEYSVHLEFSGLRFFWLPIRNG